MERGDKSAQLVKKSDQEDLPHIQKIPSFVSQTNSHRNCDKEKDSNVVDTVCVALAFTRRGGKKGRKKGKGENLKSNARYLS